jgi:hypothetical protein
MFWYRYEKLILNTWYYLRIHVGCFTFFTTGTGTQSERNPKSVCLLGAHDQYVVFLIDDDCLGKLLELTKGAQRRTILKACDIMVFLWRSASRFGWHRRNFFLGVGKYIILIFLCGIGQCLLLIEIYPKMIFPIILGRTKILNYLSDKSLILGKSARTNRKIFLIPTYSDGFQTFKKSLLVPINRSINLLLLFVRNCTQG